MEKGSKRVVMERERVVGIFGDPKPLFGWSCDVKVNNFEGPMI